MEANKLGWLAALSITLGFSNGCGDPLADLIDDLNDVIADLDLLCTSDGCATSIDSAPAELTTEKSATIEFSSAESAVVGHKCSFNGADAASCTSPVTYDNLDYGPQTFTVFGVDISGTTGPAASATWSVVVTTDTLVPAHVVINELSADNDSVLADNLGEFDDWIELWNPTTQPVVLTGMYLSDVTTEAKFEITGAISIQPGQFLVFYADSSTNEGIYHTNFSLSAGGEDVVLYSADATRYSVPPATVIDQVNFGAQTVDYSWARIPDGRDFASTEVTPATPGESND